MEGGEGGRERKRMDGRREALVMEEERKRRVGRRLCDRLRGVSVDATVSLPGGVPHVPFGPPQPLPIRCKRNEKKIGLFSNLFFVCWMQTCT